MAKEKDVIKAQVAKGIGLLQLCSDLQSEKDGVDRPPINKRTAYTMPDAFSIDIQTAATNLSSL